MDPVLGLATELAALNGNALGKLPTPENASNALQSLAYVLRDSVPGSAGAGASIIDERGRWATSGATDPVVLRADRLQYDLGQGPCLSVWAELRPIIIQDITDETRWPAWTAAVTTLPLRSVLSAPLAIDGKRLGALKVYSPAPFSFDDRSVLLIEQLAGPAAVLMAIVCKPETAYVISDELLNVLRGRDMVGRAEGILMERMHLTSGEASDVLLRASRGEGKPVHKVAQDILQATVQEEDAHG